MSKFQKFYDYLKIQKNRGIHHFTLTMSEIESILGIKLAMSARKYYPYWICSETHTFPNGIKECGYIAHPDIAEEKVTFTRG